MSDRSIFVRLGAIATGLKQGLKDASIAAKQAAADIETAGKKSDTALGKSAAKLPLLQRGLAAFKKTSAEVSTFVTKNRDDIDKLATSGLIVGGLMVAGVAVAAKRYADFDQALSHVAATGTDARMNLGALRETAIQMGADTVFSATEAAQGIEAMEKAGLSAKDILGGGLKGSLDLAAAGTLEVGQAAEIAATALVQFGLSGSDMSHVADLLAAGAGKAQGEVSDLAMAFKYVGPIASAMNISIEETVGTLAAFASQGILADQAGTSLRGVLAALTSPSKQAQAEIERLHVTLYDGNGKFLGMTNLAGQLAAAYDGTGASAKKATDAEKDMSLGILFGNQQVTAARVLLDQGAKGIEDWTKKVDEAGYASSAAATRMDNLKGDVERLSGSIDSALIQSGTGLNDVLRNMVQGAESAVDAVGKLPPGILGTTVALAGAGGLGVLGVSAVGKLVVGVNDAVVAMKALGWTTKMTGLAAGGLGIAVTLGALAFGSWAANAADAKANTDDFAATLAVIDGKALSTAATMRKFNEDLVAASAGVGPWSTSILEIAGRMGISAGDLQDALSGNAGAIDKVNDAADRYYKTVESKMSPAQLAFAGGSGDVVNWLDKERTSLGLAKKNTEAKADADTQAGIAADKHANSTKTINSYLAGETDKLGTATTTLQDYTTALWDAANAALKLSGTEIGFRQAVHDAMKGINAKDSKGNYTRRGKGVDTHTQAGRDNQGDLNQIVTSGQSRVNSLIEEKGAGKEAAGAMQELRDDYIKAATAATGSKKTAIEMADALKLIPENVIPTIEPTLNEQAMEKWGSYKPGDKWPKIRPKLTQSTFDVTLKTAWRINGGPQFQTADGGLFAGMNGAMVQRFADGGYPSIGSQQPQIQANHGPKGIMWAESGAGPWEAFISGHPGKQERSRAIASDVVARLGGVAQFANGAVLQRTLYGQQPRIMVAAPSERSQRPAPVWSPTIVGPDANEVAALATASWKHEVSVWAVQEG